MSLATGSQLWIRNICMRIQFCNSKVSVAMTTAMDEIFMQIIIIDHHTGINIIQSVVYNRKRMMNSSVQRINKGACMGQRLRRCHLSEPVKSSGTKELCRNYWLKSNGANRNETWGWFEVNAMQRLHLFDFNVEGINLLFIYLIECKRNLTTHLPPLCCL